MKQEIQYHFKATDKWWLITKENNAVLMTDLAGHVHIITIHDLIQGISQICS